MKKLFLLLLVALMMLSLSSCRSIKLEESQEMYVISSDGSVRMKMMVEGDELAADVGFDYAKDKNRIITQAINEYIENTGLDAKLNSFRKSGDYAFVDITFYNFKDIMSTANYALEDYADDYYGNLRTLADSANFIIYSNESVLDKGDIRKYAEFSIMEVSDSGAGTYYKLPGRILLVSGDIQYTKISSDTILIENGDYGYVVHKGKISEEAKETTAKTTEATKKETTRSSSKGKVTLEDDQEMYIISYDGSVTIRVKVPGEEIADEVGFNFSKDSDSNIKKAIESYLKDIGVDARINEIKKDSNMLFVDITYPKADEILYNQYYRLDDYIEVFYDGIIEELSGDLGFKLYSNGSSLDSGDLEKYYADMIIEVDNMVIGTYFEFPGKILLVSDDLEYTKIDDYTILIEDNDWGYVIYKGK